MNSGVYIIRNLADGKVYVGSSANLRVRWVTHRNRLNKGNHHCPHLQNAWNLYGQDSFEFAIVEPTEIKTLLIREQAWIDHFHSLDKEFGYNVGAAGLGSTTRTPRPHNARTKAKIAKSVRRSWKRADHRQAHAAGIQRWWAENRDEAIAKNNSPSRKRSRSVASSTMWRDRRRRARQAAKMKAWWADPRHHAIQCKRNKKSAEKRRGWHHSPETIEKLRQASTGHHHSKATRALLADISRNISPETRQRISDGLKRAWAERRAAKQTDSQSLNT